LFHIFTIVFSLFFSFLSFFFNDTATTEIYTLSLHDALPISRRKSCDRCAVQRGRCFRNDADACRRQPHLAEDPDESFSRQPGPLDRKSTRLNSSHVAISYAVFCLKKKKKKKKTKNKI